MLDFAVMKQLKLEAEEIERSMPPQQIRSLLNDLQEDVYANPFPSASTGSQNHQSPYYGRSPQAKGKKKKKSSKKRSPPAEAFVYDNRVYFADPKKNAEYLSQQCADVRSITSKQEFDEKYAKDFTFGMAPLHHRCVYDLFATL